MARVICTLPNASDCISGVKFEAHDLGVISEDLADDVAAEFLAVPGYQPEPVKEPPKVDTERADLEARAAAVALKVKNNWSTERLKTEVEAAEKDAADKAAADKAAADQAAADAAAATK